MTTTTPPRKGPLTSVGKRPAASSVTAGGGRGRERRQKSESESGGEWQSGQSESESESASASASESESESKSKAEALHDVEAILKRRNVKGGRGQEWLVRWQGYGSEEDSLEPTKNIPLSVRKEYMGIL